MSEEIGEIVGKTIEALLRRYQLCDRFAGDRDAVGKAKASTAFSLAAVIQSPNPGNNKDQQPAVLSGSQRFANHYAARQQFRRRSPILLSMP